jgi:hypothetical protein
MGGTISERGAITANNAVSEMYQYNVVLRLVHNTYKERKAEAGNERGERSSKAAEIGKGCWEGR